MFRPSTTGEISDPSQETPSFEWGFSGQFLPIKQRSYSDFVLASEKWKLFLFPSRFVQVAYLTGVANFEVFQYLNDFKES
jgi:hypothetical protein